MMKSNAVTRRGFLGAAGGAALAASALPGRAFAAEEKAFPKGTAEHCIFIWLGGGACHIDTFDPKRKSSDLTKDPGSYYDAIPTAVCGVQVSQHLSRTAPLLDRCVLVRTLHHEVLDEHGAATNRMHTGRPTSGTIVYPAIGSIVSHQLGPGADGVPPYIVMGYPSVSRGPGFLGAAANYMYLTETKTGPAGLLRPSDVSNERQARREALLGKMRSQFAESHAEDARVRAYSETSENAFRLAGPKFTSVFDLDREPSSLRENYGGEFGQRCLLARRLVQAGSRFIEVSSNLNFSNGTGWDTHAAGQFMQHELIEELDQALAVLIVDLEKNKLLDKTLVVVATEFGRPPEFDGGGGRGHQSRAFSALLAGGGLYTGRAIGETDELGKNIASRPVSVPDFHATIHCALGINPAEELYDGSRPVPITDGGKPIEELFA